MTKSTSELRFKCSIFGASQFPGKSNCPEFLRLSLKTITSERLDTFTLVYKKAIIEFHMFLQWHGLEVFIPQNSCICHHLCSYQSSLVFQSGYASPQLCPSEENEEEMDEGWRTVFWVSERGPNYKGTKLSKKNFKIAFFSSFLGKQSSFIASYSWKHILKDQCNWCFLKSAFRLRNVNF